MPRKQTQETQLAVRGPSLKAWRALQADGEDKEKREEAKIAQENLKEALLASLQMQHVVVLAGSGTSLGSVRGPSMQDLWDGATTGSQAQAAKDAAKTTGYDLSVQNIEEFLSRCEAYLQVAEDSGISDFVISCKKIILEKCSAFLDPDQLAAHPESLDAHKMFIHRLSRRRVRDPRLKVFTTNYDLCFERAAAAVGGVVIDGFSFMAPRHYDPRYFSYDIIRRPYKTEDQGSYLEGVFLLYKLHGSVNWARVSNELVQEKTKPSPAEACLIYPARGKYQQSFLQPHLESMSQYLAALREPNTCVVVMGFGFNDDHLAEPILAAVCSNPHLRLIVADPRIIERDGEAKGTNRYWQELFAHANDGEDIWFINASFQQFARLIPDLKSLTPADRLMKAIKTVAENR